MAAMTKDEGAQQNNPTAPHSAAERGSRSIPTFELAPRSRRTYVYA